MNPAGQQTKFDPKRFDRGQVSGSGARKQVRFTQDNASAEELPSAPRSFSPQRRRSPALQSSSRNEKLLWSAVLCLAIYIFIRDGWAALLASQLSLAPRRQTSILPPALLAEIDKAVSRALTPVPLRDYALAADGGMIVDDLTSPREQPGVGPGPDIVLDDDVRIGRCWRFRGSQGQVGISIPELIHPTHVTVEHIPSAVAADIGQAPRRLILWGVVDGLDNQAVYQNVNAQSNNTLGRNHPAVTSPEYSFIHLADFVYDIAQEHHVQTFPVRADIRDIVMDIGLLVLEILENWGATSTCIYRVRIHGTPREGSQISPSPL